MKTFVFRSWPLTNQLLDAAVLTQFDAIDCLVLNVFLRERNLTILKRVMNIELICCNP